MYSPSLLSSEVVDLEIPVLALVSYSESVSDDEDFNPLFFDDF
jgi:hypothetical protein